MARLDMSQVPSDTVAPYAAGDADHTLALWPMIRDRMVDEGLWELYHRIELPLIPVIADMERTGVAIDQYQAADTLYDLILKRDAQVASAQRMMGVPPDFKLQGDNFKNYLEAMGCPIKKRTPSKHLIVTDEEQLQKVRYWNPDLIDALLARQKYQTLQNFPKAALELVNPYDHRLHSSYNQSGSWEERGGATRNSPATGRISSSGPNLQNIPHHSDEEWGQRIRDIIIPTEGWRLVSFDIEQEEPRIIAFLANDTPLAEDFAEGRDIYRGVTEALYPHTRSSQTDGEWKEDYSHERYVGKTFFLAWYYGAGAGRLVALDNRIDRLAGQAALKTLAKTHPAREEYIKNIINQVESTGYVTDYFGRKRWVPKLLATGKAREEGVREAANMPVQGSAAGAIKIAMRRIWDGLQCFPDPKPHLLIQVHDEVVLECVPEHLDRLRTLVVGAFQDILPFRLPVECLVGQSWGHMEVLR